MDGPKLIEIIFIDLDVYDMTGSAIGRFYRIELDGTLTGTDSGKILRLLEAGHSIVINPADDHQKAIIYERTLKYMISTREVIHGNQS